MGFGANSGTLIAADKAKSAAAAANAAKAKLDDKKKPGISTASAVKAAVAAAATKPKSKSTAAAVKAKPKQKPKKSSDDTEDDPEDDVPTEEDLKFIAPPDDDAFAKDGESEVDEPEVIEEVVREGHRSIRQQAMREKKIREMELEEVVYQSKQVERLTRTVEHLCAHLHMKPDEDDGYVVPSDEEDEADETSKTTRLTAPVEHPPDDTLLLAPKLRATSAAWKSLKKFGEAAKKLAPGTMPLPMIARVLVRVNTAVGAIRFPVFFEEAATSAVPQPFMLLHEACSLVFPQSERQALALLAQLLTAPIGCALWASVADKKGKRHAVPMFATSALGWLVEYSGAVQRPASTNLGMKGTVYAFQVYLPQWVNKNVIGLPGRVVKGTGFDQDDSADYPGIVFRHLEPFAGQSNSNNDQKVEWPDSPDLLASDKLCNMPDDDITGDVVMQAPADDTKSDAAKPDAAKLTANPEVVAVTPSSDKKTPEGKATSVPTKVASKTVTAPAPAATPAVSSKAASKAGEEKGKAAATAATKKTTTTPVPATAPAPAPKATAATEAPKPNAVDKKTERKASVSTEKTKPPAAAVVDKSDAKKPTSATPAKAQETPAAKPGNKIPDKANPKPSQFSSTAASAKTATVPTPLTAAKKTPAPTASVSAAAAKKKTDAAPEKPEAAQDAKKPDAAIAATAVDKKKVSFSDTTSDVPADETNKTTGAETKKAGSVVQKPNGAVAAGSKRKEPASGLTPDAEAKTDGPKKAKSPGVAAQASKTAKPAAVVAAKPAASSSSSSDSKAVKQPPPPPAQQNGASKTDESAKKPGTLPSRADPLVNDADLEAVGNAEKDANGTTASSGTSDSVSSSVALSAEAEKENRAPEPVVEHHSNGAVIGGEPAEKMKVPDADVIEIDQQDGMIEL